jgi:hypothetical protein
MLLRRMGRQDITTHGFRSTFRDWTAETTNATREVAEMALAHVIPSKVEAAYRRGDLLEKRRALMDDWGAYCIREGPVLAIMTNNASSSDKRGKYDGFYRPGQLYSPSLYARCSGFVDLPSPERGGPVEIAGIAYLLT